MRKWTPRRLHERRLQSVIIAHPLCAHFVIQFPFDPPRIVSSIFVQRTIIVDAFPPSSLRIHFSRCCLADYFLFYFILILPKKPASERESERCESSQWSHNVVGEFRVGYYFSPFMFWTGNPVDGDVAQYKRERAKRFVEYTFSLFHLWCVNAEFHQTRE